jgi:hypothetical protein
LKVWLFAHRHGSSPGIANGTHWLTVGTVNYSVRDYPKNCVNFFDDIIFKAVAWHSAGVNSKKFLRKKE